MEVLESSLKTLHSNRMSLYDKVVNHPEIMGDREIVEHILIGRATRRDARSIAKNLMERFGSFGNIISAHPHDLMTVPELDETGAAALKLIRVAARRLLKSEICHRDILNSWDSLLDYLNAELARESVESIRVLFLDCKYRLISVETLFTGTVRHAVVQPRTIVKRALDLNASSLVIAHNHPSGDPTASVEDIQTTMLLRQSLSLVDLQLLDHIIIGNGSYMSFRKEGWLN